MHVLAIGESLDRCEQHLLSALTQRGVKVTALLEKPDKNRAGLEPAGISVRHRKFRGRIDPFSIHAIRCLINSEKIDIIHAFSGRALSNSLLASIRLHTKLVTYRGTVGHLHRLDPTSWLSFLNPRISKIICVSKAVEEYLSGKGISNTKLVTIYKGHKLEWYQGESGALLSDFGIPEGSFVVGCVANMRPVKGVSYLINAFTRLPEQSTAKLLLIGDVRDEKVTSELSSPRLAGRVYLTGFRDDAALLMKKCDLFVMPSINREGLPKALIEAMAQGVPAIVTKVGGMPEIVRDQIDGVVVPPQDSEAIASAITLLEQDAGLRRRFGNSARDRIRESFRLETTVEETFKVYREVLGSPT